MDQTKPDTTDTTEPTKPRRGFAGMDPKRQREIASMGGRAAHEQGTAHEFTPDEARAAGRKSHAHNGPRAPNRRSRGVLDPTE
jgi:general stress protein YciG